MHLNVFYFSFHELMQFIHSSKKFHIKLVPQILHLKFLLFSRTTKHFLWKTSISKVSLEGVFWFMNRRNMFFYFGIFAKLFSITIFVFKKLNYFMKWCNMCFYASLFCKVSITFFLFVYYVCVQILVNNDGQMTNTIFLSNWREHASQNRALKMSLFVFFK